MAGDDDADASGFAELGLAPGLCRALSGLGYEEPTPIQRAAVPPLIAGRDLDWTDLYDRNPVVLISENMARELWHVPGAAIGKRIRPYLNGDWRSFVAYRIQQEQKRLYSYKTLLVP